MKKTLRLWLEVYLPPILWLGVIFTFSLESFSAETTSRLLERALLICWPGLLQRLTETQFEWLNFGARKLAHLTEYAILGALVYRACARGRSAPWRDGILTALAISAAAALVDEAHQGLTASRTFAVSDVLVDCCGAALALFAIWMRERKRAKCRTSAFLNSSAFL